MRSHSSGAACERLVPPCACLYQIPGMQKAQLKQQLHCRSTSIPSLSVRSSQQKHHMFNRGSCSHNKLADFTAHARITQLVFSSLLTLDSVPQAGMCRRHTDAQLWRSYLYIQRSTCPRRLLVRQAWLMQRAEHWRNFESATRHRNRHLSGTLRVAEYAWHFMHLMSAACIGAKCLCYDALNG
jgi:glycerol-3-phosphate dehydrogenase